MVKSSQVAASPAPKRTAKPASNRAATPARKRSKRSETTVAIATELAPSVAIALLDKTEQPPGAPAPALDVLAVAAAPSEIDGNVRIQLMFENGAVLPVEMSVDAGAALSKGLEVELQKREPAICGTNDDNGSIAGPHDRPLPGTQFCGPGSPKRP